jgi:hypothetical protein
MNFNDKKTSVMKLVDLLKTHELLMEKCPEVIEIIENLYLDIEKNQIIEAYRNGRTDQQSSIGRWYNRSSLTYYNETFNKVTNEV